MIKGCKICSYRKCPTALQLNHINPETKTNRNALSNAIKSGGAWQRVKDEVFKCEVLCANCHAELTYKEKHHLLGACNEREDK